MSVRLLAHHALWDAWVHERDIALPLGRTPDVEPDDGDVQEVVRRSQVTRLGTALTPAGRLQTTPVYLASTGVLAPTAGSGPPPRRYTPAEITLIAIQSTP